MIDSLDVSGGAERQLVANLRAFDQSLAEHRIVVLKETNHSRSSEIADIARMTTLFEKGATLSRPALIGRLRELVLREPVALIHASLPDSALATRLVSRITGTRAIESLVNISHEQVRTVDNPHVTKAKLTAHAMLDRLTMRSLAGYHAVSRAVAESWIRVVRLNERKIRVIPRGVDLKSNEFSDQEKARDRKSIRHEFGLPSDSLVALSVGRIEPQKGHRYLVEAMALIADLIPDLYILIVGREGNASPLVESSIEKLGLTQRVKLVGSRNDLARFLAGSDFFVFPSLFEGNGGNAMIEAMAAGLPVVTTGEPPMTDLIPDESTGLLVPRFSATDLAHAIRRMAESPQLRTSLGVAARRQAEQLPSSKEIAAELETWYQELIASPPQ